MKKIITYCILLLSAGLSAQSFVIYRLNPNTGAIIDSLSNGSNLQLVTFPDSVTDVPIKIKNRSAVTHTYDMSRSFTTQNPTLYTDNTPTNKPNSYFCFGNNCFGSGTSAAGPNDYTKLTSGEDSQTSGNPIYLYISEAASKGFYIVRYKIFNISDGTDTISFNAIYNGTNVGIKAIENKQDLISELYPNPNSSGSSVSFDLGSDQDLKFQVYNSLGGLVYTSNTQKYAAGKNKLALDCASLSNGVYLINISSASGTSTKRLIINR